MTRMLSEMGVCDCHSHVFGPFDRYPLSPDRTYDPPESPVDRLEATWSLLGVDRAVLVQGSAHGHNVDAMLAAIARSPATRRGVILPPADITDQRLKELDQCGVRGVRFNWIRHLSGADVRTERERLDDACELLERIHPLSWHAEFHIDSADMYLVRDVSAPACMPLVIDHMARIDVSLVEWDAHVSQLLDLLKQENVWVKLSGADRLTAGMKDLATARFALSRLVAAAPDRCVWGLDWPHVNLNKARSNVELAEVLLCAINDTEVLKKVLITNPARLYGFAMDAN
jgi:2-pyrone-4,6-dicarboxylate lactonase